MKHLLFILTLLFLSLTVQASQFYMGTEPSMAVQALRDAYGQTAGFGAKSNSCYLCHNTASGGLGAINNSFGQDFVDAAREEFNMNGNQLTQSSLAQVFGNMTLAATDSDNDGFTNEEEFQQNMDPADDILNGSSSGEGGGAGGGCGLVGTPPGSGGGWLLLLPFLIALSLRQRSLRPL